MRTEDDIRVLVVLAYIGLAVTAPLWGPVAALAWGWDRLRGIR